MKYVIIHYNTPKLTLCEIASLIKQGVNENDIIIFENSDKEQLNISQYFNIFTLDNSSNKIINFNDEINLLLDKYKPSKNILNIEQNCSNFGSLKHAQTVQWLLDNLNEDFILLDSDVLIKTDISKIIDNTKIFVGEINKFRVLPFLLYLNSDKIKQNGIKFYDRKNIHPFIRNYYTDTGGSFLKECLKSKQKFNLIKLDDYIIHYGSGSWRSPTKNKESYQSNFKNLCVEQFLMKYKTYFM